jgi:phosphoglycerate dehydrogenase-like enzyme
MAATRYVSVLVALTVAAGSMSPAALAADSLRVCALEPVAESLRDLADRHDRLQIVAASDPDDLIEKLTSCRALIGLYPSGKTAEILEAGRHLEWIQSMSAGVEAYLAVEGFRESPVILTNAKIIQGPEIADHAFALLLGLTRDLKFFNEQMGVGFERRSRLPLIELRDKTALVIGLGGIGTQTAQRAAAFGMHVLAVDPKDVPLHRDVEHVGRPDELDALLPRADVIFSCAPLTRETRGMLGPKQFEQMKDGVYLINVSRGGIIDTDSLVAALRSGKVRGAGLDVTDPEPLPADHPLWSMPNVIITPHVAGASDGVEQRRVKLMRDNLERFALGRPLRHVVDKRKGY